MKTISSAIALLTLSLSALNGQNRATPPAFEVASITPCPPGTAQPAAEHAGLFQFTFPGGRFSARAMTPNSLLEWAYGIQPAQHSSGPSWFETDRYDVAAKAAENATDEQMKLMLRTLLAERFKLKFHYETKNSPVYVLSVGKTSPKLIPAKEGEPHAIGGTPRMGPDQKIIGYHVTGTRFSMAQLSDIFARPMGVIILDKTGLTGEYDFAIDLVPDETRPSPMDPSLLMTGLREQVGLTLKSQNVPLEILVVDSAEKVAAGN